jgi:hypothetical protein
VFAAGHIWVITGRNGDQLTGIDAATNRPGPVIKLPVGCSDLAQGTGAVWALCPAANRVVRVDVAHRLIQGTLTLAAPYAGFGTRTDLWVGSDRGLVRVDANSLEPEALFEGLNPGPDGDVAVDGDRVWVRTKDGFLHRIDARSNTVAEQIKPEREPGGGSLLALQARSGRRPMTSPTCCACAPKADSPSRLTGRRGPCASTTALFRVSEAADHHG